MRLVVRNYRSSAFVLPQGALQAWHAEAGHARLVGELVCAHLQMDEALAVARLIRVFLGCKICLVQKNIKTSNKFGIFFTQNFFSVQKKRAEKLLEIETGNRSLDLLSTLTIRGMPKPVMPACDANLFVPVRGTCYF
jgi:hypothetical protein